MIGTISGNLNKSVNDVSFQIQKYIDFKIKQLTYKTKKNVKLESKKKKKKIIIINIKMSRFIKLQIKITVAISISKQ